MKLVSLNTIVPALFLILAESEVDFRIFRAGLAAKGLPNFLIDPEFFFSPMYYVYMQPFGL